MRMCVMNTISTLTPRRMSYGVILLGLAMLVTMPATTYACACCAEPGTWFEDMGRADPEVLAITGELGGKLDPTASLYLTAAGLEEVKGISPASETYILRRLRPYTRDWKMNFSRSKLRHIKSKISYAFAATCGELTP